ncbi:MAG: hypothetical protein U9Q81_18510 [Pseudomonadota bacterium]|nr:hypothetical protein [Pseudomonadota bacterium]
MNKTVAFLFLLCAATAGAYETVTLYQLTGAIQCVDETGVPAERAADLLRGQGVKVVSAERRKLPLDVTTGCGAPTGEANVMTVAAADWAAFTAKNPDAGGYGLWVFETSTVEVYKYDGTMQCGLGHEIPLGEMAKELKAAGIEVLQSRKGTDGLTHISVCGASTGAINVYTIERDALPSARELGYRLLLTREMTQQIKPRVSTQRMVGMQARSTPRPAAKAREPIPLLW